MWGEAPLRISPPQGLRNSSRSQKPQTWWPQRSHEQGNCPASSAPAAVLPSKQRDASPKHLCCSPPKPHPALPASPSHSCISGRDKAHAFLACKSTARTSGPFPCCKRNGRELEKVSEKQYGSFYTKPGKRTVQPGKEMLGGPREHYKIRAKDRAFVVMREASPGKY